VDAIIFSPVLSGGTIGLSVVLNTADPNGVVVDATALPAGITISGNGTNRVFQNDGILTLRGVTITGGFCSPTAGGGGVLNSSVLIMERCTLTGNVGGYGAALFNAPNRSATLRQCTIAGNTATYSAGAMENRGVASFIHCTVVSNSAPDLQIGGLVNGFADGPFPLDDPENVPTRILSIENSIVANNTGYNVNGRGHPSLASRSIVNYYGLNIIPGAIPGSTSVAVINADPLVGALGNYGGTTQTMPPSISSPAIDAAIGSTEVIDQRGYSRPVDGDGNGTVVADIGAVELIPNIIVSIPPTNQTATSGTDATFSVTATGNNLSYQWFFNGNVITGANSSTLDIANINRASAGSYFVVISNSTFAVTSSVVQLHPIISQKFQSLMQGSDGRWTLKFNDLDGGLLTASDLADFEVQVSTNLAQWTILTNALTLTNGVLHFTEPNAGVAPNRYFRVRSK
jgi:hypothetical protein